MFIKIIYLQRERENSRYQSLSPPNLPKKNCPKRSFSFLSPTFHLNLKRTIEEKRRLHNNVPLNALPNPPIWDKMHQTGKMTRLMQPLACSFENNRTHACEPPYEKFYSNVSSFSHGEAARWKCCYTLYPPRFSLARRVFYVSFDLRNLLGG